MIPTKLMIPAKAIVIINPKNGSGLKVVGTGTGFGPVGIAAIMEKIKNTKDITIIIGMITVIRLAVRPNFLPDSSDILTLRCYFIAT
jgi:hypothetical protein